MATDAPSTYRARLPFPGSASYPSAFPEERPSPPAGRKSNWTGRTGSCRCSLITTLRALNWQRPWDVVR